jgi:hypothetical protein
MSGHNAKAEDPTSLRAERVSAGWYRYRNHALRATCIRWRSRRSSFCGRAALGRGEAAWSAWLASLAGGPVRALNVLCLLFTIYFAFRFGWVGRKIAAGRIGPIPKPPLPLAILGIAPLGGFVTLWLVLLVILGGFV